MNNNAVVGLVNKVAKKIFFQLKKRSPEILVGLGLAGFAGTTVMVYTATRKVDPILQEAKENIKLINECAAADPENYPVKQKRKDLALTYLNTGVELTKLYGSAAVVGALSASCVVMSNGISRERNASLAAAYAAVDTALKEYRKRFAEKYGDDAEKEFRYGVTTKKVESTIIDENGKEKKVKSTVKVADQDLEGEYAIFFDNRSAAWDKDPDYNRMFLRQKQSYMNDKLIADGFVFLNDVFDQIGYPRTRAGQVVGWVYDGTNYVDFGIYETLKSSCRDKLNGVEQVIVLDFKGVKPILDVFDKRNKVSEK